MILEELWYGNINPLEQSTEGNSEVKKLLSLVGRNRNKLCTDMTEQQRQTLRNTTIASTRCMVSSNRRSSNMDSDSVRELCWRRLLAKDAQDRQR